MGNLFGGALLSFSIYGAYGLATIAYYKPHHLFAFLFTARTLALALRGRLKVGDWRVGTSVLTDLAIH